MYTVTMIINETHPTFDRQTSAVKEIRADIQAESLLQAVVIADRALGGRFIARDAYWSEDACASD